MSGPHRIRGTWHFDPTVDVPAAVYLGQLWLYSTTVLYPMRAVKYLGLFPRTSIGRYPARAQTRGQGQLFSLKYQAPINADARDTQSEAVADFERGARLYEAVVTPFTNPVDAEARKLISRLMPPAARILDLSCGPGTQLFRLAEMVPGGEVVGVDLAHEMVIGAWQTAQRRGYRNTAFYQADVALLPAEFSAKFDAVHCSFAFHHYRRPMQALKEMNRILVREGKAFVIDGGTWWANMLAAPFARVGDPGWVAFYTGQQFADLFRSAGFSEFYWEELLPGIGIAVGTK
jgi:ubiquinone/menaquinone biosynthesis C-methylase UbiE